MPLHFATDNSDEIQQYDAFPQNAKRCPNTKRKEREVKCPHSFRYFYSVSRNTKQYHEMKC